MARPAHTPGGNQGWEGSWLNPGLRPRLSLKEVLLSGGGRLGTMETQRASLSLGQWSLWLLLLGLVLPSASAQAPSYREAVLRAVDQLNEKSSEANLYRLLELDPPPKDVEDQGARTPASFTVKETVCPKTSQQPPEQCDFKENGLQSVRAKRPRPPKPRRPHRPRPRPLPWFPPRFPGKR
ncbi:cathelicidin-4-like [Moschus berezovskii]|uniref:cathelicidin-4-like n=1 Tax=Moschus berezovskii TaxID=68408 RepID=UPI002444EFD5|nr:cathelicidin-4-like [Moschus berezovskii]XP_055269305.1 cathelicidin-4-like [Moschus berezovskii]XP_055269306.1 cathelicidin-4-like [Moschus berezovskii]